MSSSTISSSVTAASAVAGKLKAGLDEHRSFKLGSATDVADGIPPSAHDSVSCTASSCFQAYAGVMERDAEAFEQIGIVLDEADAAAALGIRGTS